MASIQWETLFLVKKNQTQLLLDRGYSVPDSDIVKMTSSDFKKKMSIPSPTETVFSRITVVATRTEPLDRILVWYVANQDGEVTVDDLREFLTYIHDDATSQPQYRHCMIISNHKLGSRVSQQIQQLSKLHIEHFMYDELIMNPLNYFLTPKYTKLTSEDATNLFTKHKIQANQMPLMFDSDKVARWYGWTHGDVVFVENYSLVESNKKEATYRLVVRAPLK
jgi:DNA-directed RNA polymerase I, II, and III subunit RPABC1